MTYHELRCPNCDAALQSINGIDHYKCPYCQSELLIEEMDDGILQARIAKTEYDYKVWKARHDALEKEKKFQRSEKAKDNKAKREFNSTILLILGIILAGLLPIIMLNITSSGYANVPFSANQFEKMSVDEAVHALRSAGFKKIECYEVDKNPGLFHSPGQIETISINGKQSFRSGKEFSKRDPVIIHYYKKTD